LSNFVPAAGQVKCLGLLTMLPSDYLAVAACLTVLLTLLLGVVSARKPLRVAAVAVAALIVVFHVIAWRLPYLWIWVLPHTSVVIVSYMLVWCAIIPLMVALSLLVTRRSDRRALLVACFLFAVYSAYLVVQQLFPPELQPQSAWNGRVMLQSNPNTCIAAAASSLLRLHGVELTERDAVDRGHITESGGNDMNAWRILRLSLPPGYRIAAGPLSCDDMRLSGYWYLLSLDSAGPYSHEIVAKVAPDGRMIDVLDPLEGEYQVHWEALEALWHRRGVWVEPPLDAALLSP